MSNVLLRNRTISKNQFYTNFVDIMNKSFSYFTNSNKFPVGVYDVYCVPFLRNIADIHRDITIANGIYPTCAHEVLIKRDFQNFAITKTEWCLNWIEFIMKNLHIEIEKDNQLKEIAYAIYDEITYLKIWRKQNNSLLKKYGDLQPNKIGTVAAKSKLAI